MSTTETMSKEPQTQDKKRESKVKVTGPGPSYLDHHFRSNHNLGPRKTPTIPNGGVWSVYAECDIKTAPKYPYEAIINLHDWRDWNTLHPDVLITKHPHSHSRTLKLEQGTFMTLTVQLTSRERTQTKAVCQHLEPLKHRHDGHASHASQTNTTRIRWTSDNANLLTPGFLFKMETVNEIEEAPEDSGGCKYRVWMTFAGMASKSLRKKSGEAYQKKVVDYVRDLKERAEKLYAEDEKRGDLNGDNRTAA